MKRFFFSLVGLLLILPIGAFAIELNLKYPSFGGIDLARDQDINQLVAYIYYFIVGISGLAAFVMIVWGGMQWLSSSGNPAQISDAKDRLKQALLGLLLVFSSFLILRVVNPDLVLLRSPALQTPPDQSRAQSAQSSTGSAGSPALGQTTQCTGPRSFSGSGANFTLTDMANILCEQQVRPSNGVIPTDSVIGSSLVDAVGSTNCTYSDVEFVRNLLISSCGGRVAGGTSGGVSISPETIPGSLCSYIPQGPGLISGVIYGPGSGTKYTLSIISWVSKRVDVLKYLKENAAGVANYCKTRDNPFCFLLDASKTKLSNLDRAQLDIVAEVCTDIVPGLR